ncbi:hypothetical protein [Pannonibacter phragmitetus]|uniref:hypothetical protein n=1 Tax=Pannonibacter phragmitetus TaxID=121719 RepID=UPI000F01FA5B|nr:hypothetical protein [Pannonibacter phragmitetus]
MSEEIKRHRLDAAPAAVLALLPEMDRLMVIVRSGGSLHERIGPVERVVRERDLLRIEGACHDSEIRLPLIKAVDFDTSSVMKDKVYPRLDFLGSGGEVLFSVTGMEGEAPFAAALAAFPRLPSLRPEHPGTPAGPEAAEEGDAGGAFLEALAGKGAAAIRFDTPAITQQWTGPVETIRPMSGYFNIITSHFHLHLQAGSVSGWREADGWQHALGAGGEAGALAIRHPAAAA